MPHILQIRRLHTLSGHHVETTTVTQVSVIPRKRLLLSIARSLKKPGLVLPDGVIRLWMLDRMKVCWAGLSGCEKPPS